MSNSGLDLSKAALVVVDVQNGFVNHRSNHIIAAVEKITHSWKSKHIFFTRFINAEGSNWEKFIGWERLRRSPETDFHPAIVPYLNRGIVVDKVGYYTPRVGAFADLLAEKAVDTVVVCGVATESCVLATALQVFESPGSIRPLVVRDAVASHSGTTANDAGMLTLERFIGRSQIVEVEDVLRAL